MKFDVIILAGGLGTRLRSVVANLPKPMAPVAGKPFLHYLLKCLPIEHINQLILSVGYKHETIKEFVGDSYQGVPVVYAIEQEPLGTGGGIKLALSQAETADVLILNGDTYFEVDLLDFKAFHAQQAAALSIALKPMDHPYRYGAVETDGLRITSFKEKDPKLPHATINGGVYFIKRSLLKDFPVAEKFSFETEVLEAMVGKRHIAAYLCQGMFIDIGIPEDYERAQELFK